MGKNRDLIAQHHGHGQALREHDCVDALGRSMGYGRVMQAAQMAWADVAEAEGRAGAELTTGPCRALTVPCVCQGKAPEEMGGCDWCCGCGWLTKAVAALIAKK